MKDTELTPLVKSDDEILEEHSANSWPPEYLYSQEFDVIFQKLFNQYLHGEFSQINDSSDFEAFHRMFKELKEKRNELEDKFFPDKAGQRKIVKEEVEIQGCRECYDKLQKLTNKTKNKDKNERFDWKNLLFGCTKRQKEGGNMEWKKENLFNY